MYIKFFHHSLADYQNTYEWEKSEQRGMNNTYKYKSTFTNLIITYDRELKEEVFKQADKDGCPIVTGNWLHMSMHLNTLLPFDLFRPKPYENLIISQKSEENGSENLEKKISEEEIKKARNIAGKNEYLGIVKTLLSTIFKDELKEDFDKLMEEKAEVDEKYLKFQQKVAEKAKIKNDELISKDINNEIKQTEEADEYKSIPKPNILHKRQKLVESLDEEEEIIDTSK